MPLKQAKLSIEAKVPSGIYNVPTKFGDSDTQVKCMADTKTNCLDR